MLFSLTSPLLVAEDDLNDLLSLDLEDLQYIDVEVNSSTKKKQSISDVPSAVYVITEEQIKRSGVRSLAEAVGLAPGIRVSKHNEVTPTVSVRGFHDGFFNKMLVMIDGRSLFSPMLSGVMWETFDVILDDVKQIEVIRGPSGTTWGANAVNGVINIITKETKETLGTYVQVAAGSGDYQEFSLRDGLQFNDSTYAKAFFKSKSQINHLEDDYAHLAETWSSKSGGVKFDTEFENSQFSISFGGTITDEDNQNFEIQIDNGDYSNITQNILRQNYYIQTNYNQQIDPLHNINVSLWYTYVDDEVLDAPGVYDTLDFELFNRYQTTPDTELSFGGGIRRVNIELNDKNQVESLGHYGRFSNQTQSTDFTYNLLLQAETHWNDSFTTIAGVKAEYFELNDTVEFSPQARGIYTVDNHNQFWAGIARSVVSPSYLELHTTYYEYQYYDALNGKDHYWFVTNNESLENEEAFTFDLGYRYQSDSDLSIDVTAFYSIHNNLRGHDQQSGGTLGSTIIYGKTDTHNDYQATSLGSDISLSMALLPTLKSTLSYSIQVIDTKRTENLQNQALHTDYYNVKPLQMVKTQLMWQAFPTLQVDFFAEYIDLNNDNPNYEINDLFTLDGRIGWQHHKSAPLIEIIVQSISKEEYQETQYSYFTEQIAYLKASIDFN
jgi:iron complex outermembrane receptor protein